MSEQKLKPNKSHIRFLVLDDRVMQVEGFNEQGHVVCRRANRSPGRSDAFPIESFMHCEETMEFQEDNQAD